MEDGLSSVKHGQSQSQIDAVIATVKCGHSEATYKLSRNIAQDRTSLVVGLQEMKQLLNDKLTDLVHQQSAARTALKTQASSGCGDGKVPRFSAKDEDDDSGGDSDEQDESEPVKEFTETPHVKRLKVAQAE